MDLGEAYETLGLDQGATLEEVILAHRTAARKFHPDRNPAGQTQFEKSQQAYRMLRQRVESNDYIPHEALQQICDKLDAIDTFAKRGSFPLATREYNLLESLLQNIPSAYAQLAERIALRYFQEGYTDSLDRSLNIGDISSAVLVYQSAESFAKRIAKSDSAGMEIDTLRTTLSYAYAQSICQDAREGNVLRAKNEYHKARGIFGANPDELQPLEFKNAIREIVNASVRAMARSVTSGDYDHAKRVQKETRYFVETDTWIAAQTKLDLLYEINLTI
ncbi:J domain-containing protein [Candidatus Woesearchaeota archaeon]|nr:J domain-containing protein [Candidatus Woesearchaeota archaeon]